MNAKRTMSNQFAWATCVICGEAVEPGRGARRINHRGSTVNVCSPSCLQTFVAEPDPYLARLATVTREWELETRMRFLNPCSEATSLNGCSKAAARQRAVSDTFEPVASGGEA